MLDRLKQTPSYEQVEDIENAFDEIPKQEHTRHVQSHKTYDNFHPIPFLSGVLLTILLLFLYTTLYPYSYENGFDTDIAALRPSVKVVPTKFTGTLKYNGEHLYIDPGASGVRYFGTPTPEVDQAWANLVTGIGNEALFPNDIIGPDVLHTLHCLNAVRKLLDSPHYYNHTLEEHTRGRRLHIDHCLDHIRQVIQCHMDITPVHTLYFKEMNTEVGDFDQVHMCRDFGQLHQFMVKNGNVTLRSSSHGSAAQNDGHGETDKAHRQGYPENQESHLPWNTTLSEYA